MKENFPIKYSRRTKSIMKSRFNGRDRIMAMNTWAVSLIRYGTVIVKSTISKFNEMDKKARKARKS